MAGIVTVIILASFIVLGSPRVQTAITHGLTRKLNCSLNGNATVGSIAIKPFNSFTFKDLCIIDECPFKDISGNGFAPVDTLLYIASASGTFSLWSIFSGGGIIIRRLDVDGGMMHMTTEQGGWKSNLPRIFNSPEPPLVPTPKPDLFTIRKANVRDFNFRYNNLISPTKVTETPGFNWNDLDIMIPSAKVRDLSFKGGILHLDLRELSMSDKGGYSAALVSGEASIGLGKVTVSDFHLTDNWSDIHIPDFGMTFRNSYSFTDFCDSVCLKAHVAESELAGMSLRYFIRTIPDNTALLDISSADACGPVNDIYVSCLRFTERGSGIDMDIVARILGLEHSENLALDATVKRAGCTSKGVTTLVREFSPKSGFDISRFAPLSEATVKGTAKGYLRDLDTDIRLKLDDGGFLSSLHFSHMTDKGRSTEVRGTARAENFALGTLLDNSLFGKFTARTGIDAVLTPGAASVRIDSLLVDRLTFKGYDYSGLEAVGRMTGKSFNGKIVCNDPNLNFLFQGTCNISPKTRNALYQFYANLGFADLKALNLDTRDIDASRVSCHMSSNFLRVDKGELVGKLQVRDIVLDDLKKQRHPGDITVESVTNPGDYRIRVSSPFVEGSYKGTGSVTEMLGYLTDITLRKDMPSVFGKDAARLSGYGGNYDMSLDFHDSRDILSFAMPGLYIADSTRISVSIRDSGCFKAGINSPRLAFGRNYIKGTSLSADNSCGSLNAVLDNAEIKAAGISLLNSSLRFRSVCDSLGLVFDINGSEKGRDDGRISLYGLLRRDSSDSLTVAVHTLPSFFNADGNRWDIDDADLHLRNSGVDVDNFRIHSAEQQIGLDGGVSKYGKDTLNLIISRLGLGLLGDLSGKDICLEGLVNGQARLISPVLGSVQANVALLADSIGIDGRMVGALNIDGNWDKSNDRMEFRLVNDKDGKKPLLARGYIYPDSGEFDMSAVLDNMDLALTEPFLTGIMSDMGGNMSGRVSASGSLRAPDISSHGLRFNSSKFRLASTGVTYTLDGPVSLTNEGVRLENMVVRDEEEGTASLTGGMHFDQDGKMQLKASMRMNGLQILDLPEAQGDRFYGKLAANGMVGITGPTDDFLVEGAVTTSGNGQVHVPLNTAVASSSSDLLTFKEKVLDVYVDPYDEMLNNVPAKVKRRKGNIRIHVRAGATPEVSALLELNKSTGNVISARGAGAVTLDMETATGKLNVIGDYKISGGELDFEIPGIVRKEFSLEDGSEIRFNGDPRDSEMDITAKYKLKTSLANLLSDTTSVSSRRLVECSINMAGNLKNPEIDFGVDVPDLSPDNRAKMAEALNTDDKVQKQFIALLVMGSFLPSEQSGVVNGSNILYSNVSQIMSNQLNNIFQKLDIPLDLGLGYQQNQTGTNIFDVAISTQLFNNRVEIGGTVGNRQYKTSKNPNGDVVGDIDISIKLDKPGQFKLNLFSHSADEYTSFLDYSQRNGIGLNYSKEYDNFWQMLREAFTPAAKKQQKQREQQSERTQSAKRTIKVEK
ncbi:MAG: translocation/assembly module TamB [Bacteroidales bacterium]|nr:translocation/assembly module TamB [Bacteroidales bacterium]